MVLNKYIRVHGLVQGVREGVRRITVRHVPVELPRDGGIRQRQREGDGPEQVRRLHRGGVQEAHGHVRAGRRAGDRGGGAGRKRAGGRGNRGRGGEGRRRGGEGRRRGGEGCRRGEGCGGSQGRCSRQGR